jgi:PPOX class probable F420-dependent enzyme
MTDEQGRRRFAAARVARLATADAGGRPHVVPLVFALVNAGADPVYSAVDTKPNRSTSLRRLANIAANPRVAVLVDHYAPGWGALWWVRADGTGRILDTDRPEARDAIARLVARYPQYREHPSWGRCWRSTSRGGGAGRLPATDYLSSPRLRTGFTSTMGVPSRASRFRTRILVPSIETISTRCSPMGFGRSGERVLNTPCSGFAGSSRGCTLSTSRRARSSQVNTMMSVPH